MGKNKKDDKKSETKSDPLKAFRGVYDQMLKSSAEQWEELARNPLFLEKMSAQIEQTVFFQNQVKEAFNSTLKTLNLPTKEDISELTSRLDNLTFEMAKLNQNLTEFFATAKEQEKAAQQSQGTEKS